MKTFNTTRARKTNKLTIFLAGLTVATAAIGPTISFQEALISPSQLCAVVLTFHALLSRLGAGHGAPSRVISGIVLFSAMLVTGVLTASDTPAAALAFANFFSGVVAGVVIGSHIGGIRRQRIDALDVGILIFVALSAYENFAASDPATTAAQTHAAVLVSWGGSNYVGAVLAITAFWLLARSTHLEHGKALMIITAVVALITATSTLSRGAVLSICAGLLWLFWHAGSTHMKRFLSRTTAIVMPAIGFALMSFVVGERFANTNADPASNIDARFVLYRLAWESFLSAPLGGTGWTGLRSASLAEFGSPVSFAHNWYLSALQIAGVVAIPVLFVFSIAIIRSLRQGSLYGAPIAATLMSAMVEPVVEGYVGALIIFITLTAGLKFATNSRDSSLLDSVQPVATRQESLPEFSRPGPQAGTVRNSSPRPGK